MSKYPSSYRNQAKKLIQENWKLYELVAKLRRQNHEYDRALAKAEMHNGDAEKMLEYIRSERMRIARLT